MSVTRPRASRAYMTEGGAETRRCDFYLLTLETLSLRTPAIENQNGFQLLMPASRPAASHRRQTPKPLQQAALHCLEANPRLTLQCMRLELTLKCAAQEAASWQVCEILVATSMEQSQKTAERQRIEELKGMSDKQLACAAFAARLEGELCLGGTAMSNNTSRPLRALSGEMLDQVRRSTKTRRPEFHTLFAMYKTLKRIDSRVRLL